MSVVSDKDQGKQQKTNVRLSVPLIVPCPHCGVGINPGAMLAGLGRGRARRYTAKERQRRADRLAKVRKLRWVVSAAVRS